MVVCEADEIPESRDVAWQRGDAGFGDVGGARLPRLPLEAGTGRTVTQLLSDGVWTALSPAPLNGMPATGDSETREGRQVARAKTVRDHRPGTCGIARAQTPLASILCRHGPHFIGERRCIARRYIVTRACPWGESVLSLFSQFLDDGSPQPEIEKRNQKNYSKAKRHDQPLLGLEVRSFPAPIQEQRSKRDRYALKCRDYQIEGRVRNSHPLGIKPDCDFIHRQLLSES